MFINFTLTKGMLYLVSKEKTRTNEKSSQI
jgi:hypothetical protein